MSDRRGERSHKRRNHETDRRSPGRDSSRDARERDTKRSRRDRDGTVSEVDRHSDRRDRSEAEGSRRRGEERRADDTRRHDSSSTRGAEEPQHRGTPEMPAVPPSALVQHQNQHPHQRADQAGPGMQPSIPQRSFTEGPSARPGNAQFAPGQGPPGGFVPGFRGRGMRAGGHGGWGKGLDDMGGRGRGFQRGRGRLEGSAGPGYGRGIFARGRGSEPGAAFPAPPPGPPLGDQAGDGAGAAAGFGGQPDGGGGGDGNFFHGPPGRGGWGMRGRGRVLGRDGFPLHGRGMGPDGGRGRGWLERGGGMFGGRGRGRGGPALDPIIVQRRNANMAARLARQVHRLDVSPQLASEKLMERYNRVLDAAPPDAQAGKLEITAQQGTLVQQTYAYPVLSAEEALAASAWGDRIDRSQAFAQCLVLYSHVSDDQVVVPSRQGSFLLQVEA